MKAEEKADHRSQGRRRKKRPRLKGVIFHLDLPRPRASQNGSSGLVVAVTNLRESCCPKEPGLDSRTFLHSLPFFYYRSFLLKVTRLIDITVIKVLPAIPDKMWPVSPWMFWGTGTSHWFMCLLRAGETRGAGIVLLSLTCMATFFLICILFI